MPARTRVVTIEGPRIARGLFGSSPSAWVWLTARDWLGWAWSAGGWAAGWAAALGGTSTWRVWNWRDGASGLTGDGTIVTRSSGTTRRSGT